MKRFSLMMASAMILATVASALVVVSAAAPVPAAPAATTQPGAPAAGARRGGGGTRGTPVTEQMIADMKAAIPDKPPVAPKKVRKLLVFHKVAGFYHNSIPTGVKLMELMAEKTKAFSVTVTEDESYFEPEKLKEFDGVMMMNTVGNDILGSATDQARTTRLQQSLQNYVKGGKGFAGMHGASDALHNWAEYKEIIGGEFVSHPWTAQTRPGPFFKIDDLKNPINASFAGETFQLVEETYMFKLGTGERNKVRVLISLDTEKTNLNIGRGNGSPSYRTDKDFLVSWIKKYGEGRVFYTSLGHNEFIFWDKKIVPHILAGIQYSLGDLEADATPIPAKPGTTAAAQ